MKKNIIDIDTVRLSDDGESIEIIDQSLLPNEVVVLSISTQHDCWHAIADMQVRGAPAIGVFAGFSYYLAAKEIVNAIDLKELAGKYVNNEDIFDEFLFELEKAKKYLSSSRPTAVNLNWALDRMEKSATNFSENNFFEDPISQLHKIVERLKEEALKIWREDIEVCKKIGEHSLSLVKKGDGLLTHCNAGKLATVKYGTATSVMYLGHKAGYDFKIYCDETRPQLQGARLTAFELASSGLSVTLLCDNMSASLMKTGKINAIFVGCDRVAANGDVANKIGTSLLAIAAAHYKVPFYVAAPTSTIDLKSKTGDDIVIENRSKEEVTTMWYKQRMTAENVDVYNPAFDITDASLITAIVTEKGIVYPPFKDNLKNLFD